MTYNAWGLKIGPFSIAKNYKSRIFSLPNEIYYLRPDIIFLQEIWKKTDRVYLVDELKKRGYHYSFFKSDQHPMIKKWKKKFKWMNKLMLGNGLLIVSKHKINFDNSNVRSFTNFTAKEEFFTRKGAIFCEVLIKGFGKVNCVNTHLGSVDFSTKKLKYSSQQKISQSYQLDELAKFIKDLDCSTPLFIGADLNIDERRSILNWFPKPSNEYLKLISDLNLVDSYRYLNPLDPGLTFSNKNDYKKDQDGPDARIDYLFHANLGNHFQPEDSQLIFNKPVRKNNQSFFLSDHFGVLSIYKIINNGERNE